MTNKIGVFDSGIGGLTTLEEIKNILPKEDFIFYADTKNNPYGDKTLEELYKITEDITDYLINKNVKLIVIACNTASTQCINHLRNKFPNMIFVGTEPAIKVACDNNYKNTLVMATPGTINSERTNELIKTNKKDFENIYLLPCDKLANAIERKDNKEIKTLLDKYLLPYKNKKIDAIVLGCTHYPHIKNDIQKYFPKSTIIDGNKGVAKRVKYQLETNNLLNNNGQGNIEFIQTK